ncbi:MAG: Rieske 2Fe-2S domain-containing protein [Legionellaceae bacterium]|nr:Rieske 2Fe-2S domain-containing protein [Legionellaceae bacterium]
MEPDANEIEVELFSKPEHLESKLKKLHKGAVFTKKEYTSDIPGYVNDMEWNFYDELHRYYVHNTYHDMFKIFSGKTFSVNLVKWKNYPFFVQVANAKIAPNLFYQTMTIFSFFYIHQIMQLEQLDREVRLTRTWYTVSHWIFKPLHFLLNRSMMKLQKKQDDEDNELIRNRRLSLRDAGYKFKTDSANFTNSNQLTNNVIFPDVPTESRFDLSLLNENKTQNITVGLLELLVKMEGDNVRVWPGICPHEGAVINKDHLCENTAQCPWHGRKFKGYLLENNKGERWNFMNFHVSQENKELVVRSIDKENINITTKQEELKLPEMES